MNAGRVTVAAGAGLTGAGSAWAAVLGSPWPVLVVAALAGAALAVVAVLLLVAACTRSPDRHRQSCAVLRMLVFALRGAVPEPDPAAPRPRPRRRVVPG